MRISNKKDLGSQFRSCNVSAIILSHDHGQNSRKRLVDGLAKWLGCRMNDIYMHGKRRGIERDDRKRRGIVMWKVILDHLRQRLESRTPNSLKNCKCIVMRT